MKILHLSTYARMGGAARAALRLHRALRSEGVDSHMLVRSGAGPEAGVAGPGNLFERLYARLQRRLDRIWTIGGRPAAGRPFSVGWLPDGLGRRIRRLDPDLVHVHWIADGFMRPESLVACGRPVVWTLHDAWAFTGGCHYPGCCQRFHARCGQCPVLARPGASDLSARGWQRRERVYGARVPALVAPSGWMADLARRSSLLGAARTEVIPNGVDLAVFTPTCRDDARARLGVPPGRQILLAGAAAFDGDPRKGWDLLQEALGQLPGGAAAGRELWTFGGRGTGETELCGMRMRRFGVIDDETELAGLYAAADVFALPSREDNLPNTAMEALACGTPVVAFAIGGLGDLIEPGCNGQLVPAFDTAGFAHALGQLMAQKDPMAMRGAVRADAERRFDSRVVARLHMELYERLLSTDAGGEHP